MSSRTNARSLVQEVVEITPSCADVIGTGCHNAAGVHAIIQLLVDVLRDVLRKAHLDPIAISVGQGVEAVSEPNMYVLPNGLLLAL